MKKYLINSSLSKISGNKYELITECDDRLSLYKELTTALLDGDIPIYKIIGFRLDSSSETSMVQIIQKDKHVIENYLQLGLNLSKLVIVHTANEIMSSISSTGILTSSNISFNTDKRDKTIILNSDCHVLKSDEPISLSFVVDKQIGNRTIEDNYIALDSLCFNYGMRLKASISGIDRSMPHKKESYLPIATNHNLKDYMFISYRDDKLIVTLKPNINHTYIEQLLRGYGGLK